MKIRGILFVDYQSQIIGLHAVADFCFYPFETKAGSLVTITTTLQEVWANAHETREGSKVVLVYIQPLHCNSLLKCAPQPKIAKNH